MESIWEQGIACLKLLGFELLLMSVCALASALLVAVWRYREIRGIQEHALKILLSASLGVGIAVVASTLCYLPGWLFLLNILGASAIGYAVVTRFATMELLITAFLRDWFTGSAIEEEPAGAKTASRPATSIPGPRKFSADPSAQNKPSRRAPLTGITYLKMRALRPNY